MSPQGHHKNRALQCNRGPSIMNRAETNSMALPHVLKRIRLHLARSKEFPSDSASHGYEFVEHGTIGDRTGLIVGRLIVVLIIVNLVAITLESVPTFQVEFEPLFTA